MSELSLFIFLHADAEDSLRNSHLFFTIHVYQYRVETSGEGQNGGRSTLNKFSPLVFSQAYISIYLQMTMLLIGHKVFSHQTYSVYSTFD